MSFWRSQLLSGFPWLAHGTSTRDFGSLRYPNGGETEDPYAAGRASFAVSLGLDPFRLTLAGNVHGKTVARVSEAVFRVDGCDALVTTEPGLAIGLKTADCLPVFFVDPKKRTVAIVHAGWKGVEAGVVTETVRSLHECGSDPRDLIVAIGPAIRACHYQTDLHANAVRQLVASGVAAERIDASAPCTACEPERFFSYRLTRDNANQMLSVIGRIS